MVFAMGTAMLLLRGLSKADFAAWALFLVFTYFLEMGRSGLIQNGMVRELALHRQDAFAGAAIRRAAWCLNLGYSLLSNLLLGAAAAWIIQVWQAPQLSAVLPVYMITNFVLAVMSHFNFVQQANHEFRGIFWSGVLSRGALFCWVLWCKMLDMPLVLEQLAWAMLLGYVAGALASWWLLRRLALPVWKETIGMQSTVDWMKRLAAYGKWVLGTNLSTMFYKNIDKLTLGYLLGPAAFAVYDAAGKVTQLVEAPSFSIASVVFPQGAERMKNGGIAGVKRLYERSVGAILAIILPLLLGIWVFAEPVMRLFAGPAYVDSADILRITAIFGLFLPFAVQFGTVLDSTGKPAVNFVYTSFTAVLNLGLSFWAIRVFGLPGAALATLTGYALSFLLMQHYLFKNFKINALNAFRHLPEYYRTGWNWLVKSRP